jgi:6-pyruvoyltetrahydropterin/6-carboxytetrahydropterin synthase
LVAKDDPKLAEIMALSEQGIADVIILDAVGCEKFAELAANFAQIQLELMGINKRVKVVEVECFEHGANSAIYRP